MTKEETECLQRYITNVRHCMVLYDNNKNIDGNEYLKKYFKELVIDIKSYINIRLTRCEQEKIPVRSLFIDFSREFTKEYLQPEYERAIRLNSGIYGTPKQEHKPGYTYIHIDIPDEE
jgi:hypothetical protein